MTKTCSPAKEEEMYIMRFCLRLSFIVKSQRTRLHNLLCSLWSGKNEQETSCSEHTAWWLSSLNVIKCETRQVLFRNTWILFLKAAMQVEVQCYFSPWGQSSYVVCSWEQEAVVLPVVSCGQIVLIACHHNADVGEGSTSDDFFHISTSTYMYLEDSLIVNTMKSCWTWKIVRQRDHAGFDCSTILQKTVLNSLLMGFTFSM